MGDDFSSEREMHTLFKKPKEEERKKEKNTIYLNVIKSHEII